jgi:uncharacterized membrane protein required for colicin V production
VEDEWQERPSGQTSSYALALGWFVMAVLDLGFLVPGRHGFLQVLTLVAGFLALAFAFRFFKEARALGRQAPPPPSR